MKEITELDKQYLRRAIELAKENIDNGGGPFGAVIVRNGEILAESGNRVTANNDPTAHAEVMAIRQACSALGTFSLKGSTIYASCEPCPMCLGAIYWAGIDRVIYGAIDADAAKIDFSDKFIYDEIALPREQRSVVFRQALHEEALMPFRYWAEKDDKVKY